MDEKNNSSQGNGDNSLNLSASTPQGNSSLPNMTKLKLNFKRPETENKEELTNLQDTKENKMPLSKLQLKKESLPPVIPATEVKQSENAESVTAASDDKKADLSKLKMSEQESASDDSDMELPMPESADFSKTQKIKSVKEIPLQKVPNLKNLKTPTLEADKKEELITAEVPDSIPMVEDELDSSSEETDSFLPEKKSKKNIIILAAAIIILVILIYFVFASVGTLFNY